MQVAIQVFVKMPSGKTLQIDVDPTTNTCFDLKEKIATCLVANKDKSYLPNQQILSFSSMSPQPWLDSFMTHSLFARYHA